MYSSTNYLVVSDSEAAIRSQVRKSASVDLTTSPTSPVAKDGCLLSVLDVACLRLVNFNFTSTSVDEMMDGTVPKFGDATTRIFYFLIPEYVQLYVCYSKLGVIFDQYKSVMIISHFTAFSL